MLQMTRRINTDWKHHVADTGVTCYTCHRGQNIPANVWFTAPPQPQAALLAGNSAGQNRPAASVGLTSLPYDPLTPFLLQDNPIRVVGSTALPVDNRHSIKQTEWTYGLMMHMSDSLGVNCTYCHNSRSFQSWDMSTPQRETAWYGIRMVRELNNNYLLPLSSVFPPARHGAMGDVAKIDCATCHQGVFKPLYGASMLKHYPELAGVVKVCGVFGHKCRWHHGRTVFRHRFDRTACRCATDPGGAGRRPASQPDRDVDDLRVPLRRWRRRRERGPGEAARARRARCVEGGRRCRGPPGAGQAGGRPKPM